MNFAEDRENMKSFPMKVLNRLKLGRPVAAEAKSSTPSVRSWILVEPKDENDLSFVVWHIQINQKFIGTVYEDGFPYGHEDTVLRSHFANNTDELTEHLQAYSVEPDELRHPYNVPDFASIWQGIKEIPLRIDYPRHQFHSIENK